LYIHVFPIADKGQCRTKHDSDILIQKIKVITQTPLCLQTEN